MGISAIGGVTETSVKRVLEGVESLDLSGVKIGSLGPLEYDEGTLILGGDTSSGGVEVDLTDGSVDIVPQQEAEMLNVGGSTIRQFIMPERRVYVEEGDVLEPNTYNVWDESSTESDTEVRLPDVSERTIVIFSIAAGSSTPSNDRWQIYGFNKSSGEVNTATWVRRSRNRLPLTFFYDPEVNTWWNL